MPRYYVKNKENKWNVFSSVIDDFLIDDFVDFEELERFVIFDAIKQKRKELKTLLTDKPELNVMDYEEAIKIVERKNNND